MNEHASAQTAQPQQVVLEMKGIAKSFPGVKALDGVNLCACQAVHVLVGENASSRR
jgi:putative multiple sugar transport system ATP-binding protein